MTVIKNPKSILLVHRASCDWLNKRLVPLMRKKYSCRFTIVCGHPVKEFSKRSWVSSEDFVISLNDIQDEALAQDNDKNQIYEIARKY